MPKPPHVSLPDLLAQCTVRLTVDRSIGTGFFVAPGLILTCAHVVEAAKKGSSTLQVHWDDKTFLAGITEYLAKPYPDLALLQISHEHDLELQGHPFVYLLDSAKVRDPLYSFGYTPDFPGGIPRTVECEGRALKPEVLELKKGQLQPGMSGSPLLNLRTGTVCGIVKSTRGRHSDLGGRAIPANIILENFKKLEEFNNNIYEKNSNWNFSRERELEALASSNRTAIAAALFQLESYKVSGRLPPKVRHQLASTDVFTGRKSQLTVLNSFWVKEGRGVIAIVGIGGAGKTSIVQRFLETNGWLESSNSPIAPDGLFIWSFYEKPSTTEFLQEAFQYFSQWVDIQQRVSSDEQRASAFALVDVLEKANHHFLIIMDGLEKMQAAGDSIGLARGSLTDPPLRHLLLQTARGACGRTKVIVTSRFPLTDLEGEKKQRFQQLNVDKLELEAARGLVRKLGVRGSNAELDRLADEYGRHALTLDLLGRYLVEYHDGDPATSGSIPTLEFIRGSAAQIDHQANRLARVLRAYETKLEAAELAVLERLSLFRQSVSLEFLTDVFLDKGNASVSGAMLGLNKRKLKLILHSLGRRGLVEALEGTERYSSHPIVRDHFYIRLINPKGLHDAIRVRLATLVNAPGTESIRPTDPEAIHLVEELIHHTARTGRTEEAFQVYKDRLGYLHLGWALGDHARGVEVINLFGLDESADQGDIERFNLQRLLMDTSLYLKNLGRLDESIQFFKRVVSQERSQPQPDAGTLALALQNLSAVQVLRGRLLEARSAAQEAVTNANITEEERLLIDCRVRLATALALQGDVNAAQSLFNTTRLLLTKERKKNPPRDLPGIRHGWLLIRLGAFSQARAVLQETRDMSELFNFGIITARTDALIAELAILEGRIDDGKKAYNRLLEWAEKKFDQEMFVAAHMISSLLALNEGKLMEARKRIQQGIDAAEEWGYSIYWIDFKNALARINLAQGDIKSAERNTSQALYGAVGKYLSLFGAASPESQYVWGQADALHTRGEIRVQQGREQAAVEDLLMAKQLRTSLQASRLTATLELLKKLGLEWD